jgi:histidinol dehydrogenase
MSFQLKAAEGVLESGGVIFDSRGMIAVWRLTDAGERAQVEARLKRLRLDAGEVAMGGGRLAEATAAVQQILVDVAIRGDAAIVDLSRQFDDPNFDASQIRVTAEQMATASKRLPGPLIDALRRSIIQVREYQARIAPKEVAPLKRLGVELGLRFTPVASAGLYIPGGKAAYPSSLIMTAVPALVAGVGRIVVCSPANPSGGASGGPSGGDVFLAACHELRLTEVFRAGGAAAIAAMAVGTKTIPAVDKIVGPGNLYVQLAKQMLAGCVGTDGFLGPSEILIIADERADAAVVAADMVAQAEHDPGSAFLLTTSQKLAGDVVNQLTAQAAKLPRREVITKALDGDCAIIIGSSLDELVALADRFACEHVSLQTGDNEGVLSKLRNAGCVFVGPWSAVAAGDYLAGPSHSLPTNTTARFASGVSVFEFLKRTSIVRYNLMGLSGDAAAIVELAEAEGLGGHAASIKARIEK